MSYERNNNQENNFYHFINSIINVIFGENDLSEKKNVDLITRICITLFFVSLIIAVFKSKKKRPNIKIKKTVAFKKKNNNNKIARYYNSDDEGSSEDSL